MKEKLLGAVVCGGRSRRMGRDKATLRRPDGTEYLEHAVKRLQSIVAEVCLFGNVDYRVGCRIVPDEQGREPSDVGLDQRPGPIAGVLNALKLARAEAFDACVVTPVDMPDLTTEELQQLVDAWRDRPLLPVCGISEIERRLQPLAAVYPVVIEASMRRAASSADRSLVGWFGCNEHQQVALPEISCRNINSPEDFSNEYDTQL